jgi:mannose-6-phosphate isomerase
MTIPPLPLIFRPIFKPKPWGGRSLEALYNKPLPPNEDIGESWELVSLPDNESVVAAGPLAGKTLAALVDAWDDDLLGDAQLIDDRFPLLIKFLDARENLSVQVHPKPPDEDSTTFAAGVKHEAWYILSADPGATLFIGANPGVGLADLARAADTPGLADLIRARLARPGDCFYLPSGVIHALGAGLVVAEVQTPSDTTYRLYDWDRLGPDGHPRDLHIDAALANIRLDVPEHEIVQPGYAVQNSWPGATRLATCERFTIEDLTIAPCEDAPLPERSLAVWVVLAGCGVLERSRFECPFRPGDVVLIPANHSDTRVTTPAGCRLLTVAVPHTR